MEVFAVLCDKGSAAYWKSLQIPVISSVYPATLCTPIVTRGQGSFRYQGVSTRGVRHSPVIAGHSPGFNCIGPRGASKKIGLGQT